MTVAVACNLSEGVVIGVDSAVTVTTHDQKIVKVYENAEKLFGVGKLPIAIGVFGMAILGSRTIGSFVQEFEKENPKLASREDYGSLGDLVERLRLFFCRKYDEHVVPILQEAAGAPLEQIPANRQPAFGLVVGGFSNDAFLSEVWEIVVPRDREVNSARQARAPGSFGSNWFANSGPIRRYIKGFEPELISTLTAYFSELLGRGLNEDEKSRVNRILAPYEYQVAFPAMPMNEGVSYTRFLVQLVVNHYRFALGAPVVGGKMTVGKITYSSQELEFVKGE